MAMPSQAATSWPSMMLAVVALSLLASAPSAGGEQAGQAAGQFRAHFGFLARRGERQGGAASRRWPFEYLPSLPVGFRGPAQTIPDMPPRVPLLDEVVMTPIPTPGPSTVRPGVVELVPPKGLEGWYHTLPPQLVPGWAQGATDAEYRYFLRCLGGPPPCPYTLPPLVIRKPPLTTASPWSVAAGLPFGLSAPVSVPANFLPRLEVGLLVQGVDFAALGAAAAADWAFRQTVQLAIAAQAGAGVSPATVQLVLSAGSVAVHASLPPPDGTPPQSVLAALQGATHLCNTVATLLAAAPPVAALSTGPISVTVTAPPVLNWVPPALSAPAPAVVGAASAPA